MRLSLGIFAHNEEQNIGATLESLFRQSVLKPASAKLRITFVEIICLPNGCTDRTAEIAAESGRLLPPFVIYRVVDIPQSGKSRTWNLFVHELSDPAADFLILLDADIIFESDDVLEQLLLRLEADE